ncbi:MAG: HAD family hydrolase [Cyclonatronaceae bacterium]
MHASLKPVFLFDIDGTLLSVKKDFSRPFIQRCLASAGIGAADLDHSTFAGRTDRDIFLSIVNRHEHSSNLHRTDPEAFAARAEGTMPDNTPAGNGFPQPDMNTRIEQQYDTLKSIYIEQLNSELQPEHVTVFDGVLESIDYCINNDIPIALLTGNFRETAFVKLNRAGLDRYFSRGSFGCDDTDRNRLAIRAVELSKTWYGQRVDPSRLVVIGDTPRDIGCARHAGLHAVAVATGHYRRNDLAQHQPDLLLDGLHQPEKWIKACLEQVGGNIQ